MAQQDFSELLAGAPDAQPAPEAKPAAAKAPAMDFSELLAGAPEAKKVEPQGNIFDALLQQESGGRQFDKNGNPITSRKGAIGIAQVMPATAPEAARLAGLPFDDLRYRTDAEYNKALGRAYFNKQLQDFGDPAKALAAYNAGPGAMRKALQMAEENGNPDAWLSYLPAETRQYVPAIFGRLGRMTPTSTQDTGPAYSNTYVPPIPPRTAGEAVKDVALGGAAGVMQGVGMVAGAFGADNPVARFADDSAKGLMDMQSPARKAERQQRSEAIRAAEASGSTWEEIKANVGAFLDAPIETTINALGTSAPTLLMSIVPGLGQAQAARYILQGAMGAAQGAGAVKSGIYEEVRAKVEAELVKSGMDKAQAAVEAEKVAVGAQAYDSENGGNIAAGAILGVAAGTTGIEGVATKILKGPAAREQVERGLLRRTATGTLKESPMEGLQGGQERYASNVALQNEGFDVPTFQGVAGQAAGEAIASAPGGAIFGALDRGGQAPAPVPPALAPVAEKAAEPDSPLSKAAIAGAQAGAAQPAPQAPVDPATRLAELEAIGKGTEDRTVTGPDGQPVVIPGEKPRFFTPEEKAEYDQLKKLRDSTPGMTPEDQEEQASAVDEILNRTREIERMLRTNGGLEALRSEDSPVSVNQFLNDLARAKSKSTPAAAREQSLNRIESVAELLGFDLPPRTQPAAPAAQGEQPRRISPEAREWMASRPTQQPTVPTQNQVRAEEAGGLIRTTKLSDGDRRAAIDALNTYRNTSLPKRTRDNALAEALAIVGRNRAPTGTRADEQTPAVLQDIQPQENTPEYFLREAERREEGAYQFRELGYDDEANALLAEADSLRERAASARAGDLGVEDAAEAQPAVSSPVAQQTVDEATRGLPRTAIPAEDPNAPPAENTAQRRKRKGQIQQLVDNGFDTVERRDNQFVLRNTKTNQEVLLDSPADAQMARQAIKNRVDSLANTAAASPLNDRLEPTEAQIAAGNYKKSDVIEINGVKVKIENPAGSVRRGVSPDGKPWETKMVHHYGEILGTEGADGDRVDVFIGNRPDSNRVFVVDQVNQDGTFDEHKLVFGALNEEDARRTYLANYEPGWTGLGAISEIPLADLKTWLKDHAKKPAVETGIDTVSVNFEGKNYSLPVVPVDSLGESNAGSAARGEPGSPITKKQAILLKALAGVFGKDIVFFRDPQGQVSADGFVKDGDNVTIYLNERSGISPLAVFGHELMHLLRQDNPKAYAAIEKVVRARVVNPKGFRADYYGKDSEQAKQDGDLSRRDLEELISDLNGNLMSDEKFWKDVFDQIQKDNGKESRDIIAQLAAFIQRIIDGAIASFKDQPKFRAERFVRDMDAVRAAMRDGLARYAKSQGITKAAMQADVLRASNKMGDGKKSSQRPSDGLTVEAYHFSPQPRQVLSTGFYGSGLQGSDRGEIMDHPDRRLRERLSFYVNKGTGVRPEQGVGPIAHKATLSNIYDADADMKRLKQGRDKRGFESAVLNSGYSGYLTRMDGTQPGQVILLGRQTVQPEVLGMRTQIDDAQKVPAPQQRPMDLGDKIIANKSLPAGQLTPQRWAQVLMNSMPAEAAQLMEIGALSGDKPLYKDELARRARELSPEIKRSTKRAQDEYAEVEAKYKGTDQWMKAPNGAPTRLTERQWVQVRTPAFKAWFGDWEEAAKKGGVWAMEPGTVSVVVDDNGEPLVVYHGTDKGGFMQFNQPSGRGRGDLGIFTTDNWDMARSYVRKNRVQDIEPLDPKTAAEEAGVEFFEYTGKLSSRGEDQTLYGYNTPYGDEITGFQSMDEAVQDAADAYADSSDVERVGGIYELFLNIRDPYEESFEGASWNGERTGQYQVLDANGEPIYDDEGNAYLEYSDAQSLAEINEGAEVVQADGTGMSTDDVVRNAWDYKNDGAIIRAVVDDGGGPGGYYGDPADVFVALDPRQVKSASFNGGEFNPESADIRRSTKRAPQDPAIEDRTDVSKLPKGREIPASAAVGGLESSLNLARSKTFRRGRDLKQDIQDRVLAAARSARVRLNERTQATFQFLANMVVNDAKYALLSNQNAVGWYDQKVSRAIGALSTVHPEIETDPRSRLAFLWALATTSNGLKVDMNFDLAERAYRSWKSSNEDVSKRRMPTDIGIGNAAQAINKGMAAYNNLVVKVGDERLLKFMSTKFDVGQIKRMLGMSVGGEWASTPVRGAAILGPKIGNGFYSNLNGYFDALTMDRWLMRTWGRMTGTLLETDRAAIEASRKKLGAKIAAMSDAERRSMSEVIGRPVRKKMTRAELDAVAKASQKASMKKAKRDIMMAAEGTNEFRKAANLHHMTLDGQKEAPSGPAERNWIRAVFQEALGRLNAEDINMTMSDLQALLWYPERRLYDAAKSEEDVADGYEDDEAPDYANAAYDLAVRNGVDPARVNAAMDAAEVRGTVKAPQLTDEEKAGMLAEFRSPPAQTMQLLYEVAPDPDNKELTDAWNQLPMKERVRVTKLVKDAVLKDVFDALGIDVGKTVQSLGGYERLVNPNLITEYKSKTVSYEQARALAAAVGYALDQKSVVVADPRAQSTRGLVRVMLNSKAESVAPALMRAIGEATGATDFTARGNNIDILNFTELSTESLADRIEEAIDEFDGELEFSIAYGDVRSELIGKEQYESEIQGSRPESGREILQGLRSIRERARGIVAAELRGSAGQVPESAGSARRSATRSPAAPARSPDDVAVREQGGLRGGARSLDAAGRPDQGNGREEDGSLKGLPRNFNVAGVEIRASHWAPAEEVARRYMEQAGLEYRPPTQYAKVDPERAKRIAAEYDKLKHDPKNPLVKAAYQALARETIAQYQAVVDSGLEVEFIDFATQGDPYAASPRLMTEDVRNNNHMWVFSTRDGFGTDAEFDPEDNPLLAETDFIISGKRALVNDLFRVVHDYFGHVKEGVGFRADGEENTWRAHSSMFSPLAQRALTTETRGQNSWVNFGPKGEQNRKASAGETHYADQKTGLLPLWVSEEGRYDDVQRSPARVAEAPADDEIVIDMETDSDPMAPRLKDAVTAEEARGRRVSYEVQVEDTGETARMTVDAGEALADYDDRINTMTKLLECLKK